MDDRLKKDVTAGGRESRAAQDHGRKADELASREGRRSAFRSEWVQEVLPKAPEIPGFHTCWLSSTNTYDPLHRRQRLGYTLVRADELPEEFNANAMKSAQYDGAISCNEMLLYKIPMDVYQDMMTELHHDAPMREAEKLQANYQALQERARIETGGKARATLEGDGMNPERTVAPPVFEG